MRIVGVQAGKSGYTIADGIYVKQPGELTMGILEDRLDDLIDVTDDQIAAAIVLLLERTKLLVEGAGAVGVAAILADKVGGEGPVCALLSGGNIDATLLISVMRHGMSLGGRYLVVRTNLPDRPGELLKLLDLVAKERVNVVSVGHHREGAGIHVAETGVELTLQTRDEEHCEAVLAAMVRHGYPVQRLR
jgi:threonine dehydratase